MNSWLIEEQDKLYLYDRKKLNQLKVPEAVQAQIRELLHLDTQPVVEIDEELAAKLMRKPTTPSSSADEAGVPDLHLLNLASMELQAGIWYLLPLAEDKALVLYDVTEANRRELQAATPSGSIDLHPMVLLYTRHLMKEQVQAGGACRYRLDLQQAAMWEEVQLLSDVPSQPNNLGTVFQTSSDTPPLKRMEGLEHLERRLIQPFLFRSNDLLQIPYKVATSQDGHYAVGENGLEQALKSSCRNLERQLEATVGNGRWWVAENHEQMLIRMAQQVLEETPAEGNPQVVHYRVPYVGIEKLWKINAMLDAFDTRVDRLVVEVRRHREYDVYGMRAVVDETVCTPWLYSLDPSTGCHEVLEHYYALSHQNHVSISSDDAGSGSMEAVKLEELPPANRARLLEWFERTFLLHTLNLPGLQDVGVHLLHLQRK